MKKVVEVLCFVLSSAAVCAIKLIAPMNMQYFAVIIALFSLWHIFLFHFLLVPNSMH